MKENIRSLVEFAVLLAIIGGGGWCFFELIKGSQLHELIGLAFRGDLVAEYPVARFFVDSS